MTVIIIIIIIIQTFVRRTVSTLKAKSEAPCEMMRNDVNFLGNCTQLRYKPKPEYTSDPELNLEYDPDYSIKVYPNPRYNFV